MVEYPKEFDHVGLLGNEPPERSGCSFLSHPTSILKRHVPRHRQFDTSALLSFYDVSVLIQGDFAMFV